MSEAPAKNFPSLKAYRSDRPGNGAKISSFLLLEKWESELQSLSSSDSDAPQRTLVLEEIRKEQAIFQHSLMSEVVSQEAVLGKQQLVEMNHRKLLHLADLVSVKTLTGEPPIQAYEDLENVMESIIRFIEEFFGNYLDENRPVPPFLVRQLEAELPEKLSLAKNASGQNSGVMLDVVIRFISNLFGKAQTITVRELKYAKQLVTEITYPNVAANENRLRNRLYFLNFNEENFVMAEFERLAWISESRANKIEKLAALRLEQKRINQLPVMYHDGWTQTMPSIKEQVNGWISEEIRFIESGSQVQAATAGLAEGIDKIHTSLSVAKLAVIIRLLVIDKIIINRNVAPMLRVVAKLFTTLQRDEISVGSLETKYHVPDKLTIAAVRDMLFKWINILGKLEKAK